VVVTHNHSNCLPVWQCLMVNRYCEVLLWPFCNCPSGLNV
jgi:hypothetical protein